MMKAEKAGKLTHKYVMEDNFSKAAIRSLKAVFSSVKIFGSGLGSHINTLLFKHFCRKVCRVNNSVIKYSIRNKYYYVYLRISYDKKHNKLDSMSNFYVYSYVPIKKGVYFKKGKYATEDDIEYLKDYIKQYYEKLKYKCNVDKEENDNYLEYRINIKW